MQSEQVCPKIESSKIHMRAISSRLYPRPFNLKCRIIFTDNQYFIGSTRPLAPRARGRGR